jgi:transcriptional regulator with XRE-family HTH domain
LHDANYHVNIYKVSDLNKSKHPFELLGKELQKLRNGRNESLAEVSGAVEIEIDELSSFEKGISRPGEDILALLISHFEMKDKDSDKLWNLAGYENSDNSDGFVTSDDTVLQSQPVFVLPIDARIVYTDLVHVMVNNYGVVVNFMQSAGPSNQPLAVSRIGMSKEHAYSLLEVLQNTLEQSSKPKEIKQIPANVSVRKNKTKNKDKENKS